jgi:integrase
MVRMVVRRIPGDVAGVRDRALILLGFAGALRRSELVALDLESDATNGLSPKIRVSMVFPFLNSPTSQSRSGLRGRLEDADRS